MSAELRELLPEFFRDYLRRQKGVSPNTVRSYRDTFKLLIGYLSRRRLPGRDLRFQDLGNRAVLDFLEHLEDPVTGRGNSPRTRNQRLAAIQAFFRYVALHHPRLQTQARRVLAIPVKRAPKRSVQFLAPEELETLLAQPSTTTSDGIRDLAILAFLYNTGARAQEAADVRLSWFDFPNRTVEITGKGNKQRLTPLWPATARLLEAYRRHHRRKPSRQAGDHFFINQRAGRFTRFGIRAVVKRYLRLAAQRCPSIAGKRLSAHSLRHTCAVHLLRSKVGPNVIKDWLGHASIKSTEDTYLHTDLEHKRRILQEFGPPQYVASALDPKSETPPEKLLELLDEI